MQLILLKTEGDVVMSSAHSHSTSFPSYRVKFSQRTQTRGFLILHAFVILDPAHDLLEGKERLRVKENDNILVIISSSAAKSVMYTGAQLLWKNMISYTLAGEGDKVQKWNIEYIHNWGPWLYGMACQGHVGNKGDSAAGEGAGRQGSTSLFKLNHLGGILCCQDLNFVDDKIWKACSFCF